MVLNGLRVKFRKLGLRCISGTSKNVAANTKQTGVLDAAFNGSTPAFGPGEVAKLFERSAQSEATQEIKISKDGSERALLNDLLNRIRETRQAIDAEEKCPSPGAQSSVVDELSLLEKQIVHRVLKRVDPMKETGPRLEHAGEYIDPFWNPFKEVDELRSQIRQEFSRYMKLEGTAEAIRAKGLLRRRYRLEYGLADPLSGVPDKSRLDSSIPENPKAPAPIFFEGTPERFWDPSTLRRRALWNNNNPITWRSLHLLKFFVNEGGMLMPRRLTMASRRQQTRIRKAIKTARSMNLFPVNWRPPDTEWIPVEDPMQFLADILFVRVSREGNERARAMLRTMMTKYPDVDFRQFLRYESRLEQLVKLPTGVWALQNR